MRVKLLTFRYSATLGGFDETPLVDFLRDKEVIAFREHFYSVNDVPHLSCVVHYQDAVVPREALEAARETPRRPTDNRRRNGAPDPCEGLDEAERALFNHLREWRASLAHDEGVPPYVILTNKQLVAIIRRRPNSPTALGHIEGLGPGKVKRYGSAILERLRGAPNAESPVTVERAPGAPSDGTDSRESTTNRPTAEEAPSPADEPAPEAPEAEVAT